MEPDLVKLSSLPQTKVGLYVLCCCSTKPLCWDCLFHYLSLPQTLVWRTEIVSCSLLLLYLQCWKYYRCPPPIDPSISQSFGCSDLYISSSSHVSQWMNIYCLNSLQHRDIVGNTGRSMYEATWVLEAVCVCGGGTLWSTCFPNNFAVTWNWHRVILGVNWNWKINFKFIMYNKAQIVSIKAEVPEEIIDILMKYSIYTNYITLSNGIFSLMS